MTTLPPGWREDRLGDLCLPTGRRSPRKEEAATFTYVDISAIDNAASSVSSPRLVTRADAPSRAVRDIRANDVLFSLVRPYLRNIARVPSDLDGQVASSGFAVLRAGPDVTPAFLFYAVTRPEFIAAVPTRGHHSPSAREDEFLAMSIPVPPLDEQRAIVEAIEKQFTRLDAASQSLSRVERWIVRFRSAVLEAAVTGQLTTGASSWGTASVGELAAEVRYGTSTRASEAGDVPVLRMGNVVDGRLRLDRLKYLPAAHQEFPGLLLQRGDILFNRTNSPELVGKAALFAGELEPCSFASYLIRVRLGPSLDPQFLVYFLNSPSGRTWARSVVSQQVGQANINGSKLKALSVPVPPADEQTIIVARVESLISLAHEAGRQGREANAKGDSLRRAVFSRAFSGELSGVAT